MSNLLKYEVLRLLAKSMPAYAATQWLKSENESLGNQSPSDLLKNGEAQKVFDQLEKEIQEKKKN